MAAKPVFTKFKPPDTSIKVADAIDVAYDNAASGLAATEVKGAIDEVEGRVDTIEGGYVTSVGAGDGLTDSGTAQAPVLDVVGGDGIAAAANSIAVDLSATSGLAFVTGTLEVDAGFGIVLGVGGVNVALATSGGLKGDGASQLTVEPADFAGAGLEDDGADNLRIAAAAAGDGLSGGGGSALAVSPQAPLAIAAGDVTLSYGNGLKVPAGTLEAEAGNLISVDASGIHVDPSITTWADTGWTGTGPYTKTITHSLGRSVSVYVFYSDGTTTEEASFGVEEVDTNNVTITSEWPGNTGDSFTAILI